jgi:hypothetical protein
MNNKSFVFFLTHNCESIFYKTLNHFFADEYRKTSGVVLYDESSDKNLDILNSIPNITIYKAKNIVSSIGIYDCLGGAHNFVLEYLYSNPQLFQKYDYFWIIENDVYFHGNLINLLKDYDYNHHCDLLVPEFGLRESSWIWPNTIQGIPAYSEIGIFAPICRISSRLANLVSYGIIDRHFCGFFESLLPNLCICHDYSIRTFKPQNLSIFNPFKAKTISLIEQDILNNTEFYIEKNKLYHPIKL